MEIKKNCSLSLANMLENKKRILCHTPHEFMEHEQKQPLYMCSTG